MTETPDDEHSEPPVPSARNQSAVDDGAVGQGGDDSRLLPLSLLACRL
jgi:hypothetical protein